MHWRLKPFVSWVTNKIPHTWFVRIQTIMSVWQMFGVLVNSSTACGLLPSIWLVWSPSGSLVWWWTCHCFADLPICYLRGERGKKPLGSLRLARLISALLRSDARTIEGEECARLNTSCKNSKQLSIQTSATHPLNWACTFLFAILLSFNDLHVSPSICQMLCVTAIGESNNYRLKWPCLWNLNNVWYLSSDVIELITGKFPLAANIWSVWHNSWYYWSFIE